MTQIYFINLSLFPSMLDFLNIRLFPYVTYALGLRDILHDSIKVCDGNKNIPLYKVGRFITFLIVTFLARTEPTYGCKKAKS